ncbi:ribonuclease P protein component [Patescibacteria group bacterium]|nr:ribonuclease P protein component [Patescibacteria group bacterium]
MLPRQNRLTKKRDFDSVFKNGKGAKEGFLFLKTVPNKLSDSRFAFITSQKMSKKATVRNKIRRQLREIIKTNIGIIKKGTDCAIVVLPGFNDVSFWDIEKDMMGLLKKAKLVK